MSVAKLAISAGISAGECFIVYGISLVRNIQNKSEYTWLETS